MEHEQNESGMVRPWLLIVLIIIVLAGIVFFAWNYYQGQALGGAKTGNENDMPFVVPTK